MRQLWKQGAVVVSAVIGATLVTALARVWASDTMFVFFVAAAVIATWAGGWKVGAAAAVLSSAAVDWLFLPSSGLLGSANSAALVRLVSFLAVAALVVVLTNAMCVARSRAEAARRDAEAAREIAEHASQARAEFLSTLSHEVRTPINALIGYADLLQAGVAGSITPAQTEYVERLRTAGNHLLSVVNDVLDLAKADAGRMRLDTQRLAIAKAVSAAASLILPQATAKGILLEVDHGDRNLDCSGDLDRVRQIVVNLLGNAVKFTPAGGRVTVDWGAAVRDNGAAGQAWLRVRDSGIGIADADRARIFEPFEQVAGRNSRAGSGLGLAISRSLARAMGGDLMVESSLGFGASFTLWLPIAETTGCVDSIAPPPTLAASAREDKHAAGCPQE